MANPFQGFARQSPQAGVGPPADVPTVPNKQRTPLPDVGPSRKRGRGGTNGSQAVDDAPIPKGLAEKLGTQPLRLIIVGHNPSEQAWAQGHYYANPSNHMWRILKETGIAPEQVRGAQDDDLMPSLAGVGFTDVGTGTPGTNSADFGAADFKVWAVSFYRRLAQHLQDASAAIGCTCGTCGAPAIVAFAGKRHFAELLKLAPPTAPGQASAAVGAGRRRSREHESQVPLGVQEQLPASWPLPSSTEVWVMTSTSGASALTRAARLAPWQQLSVRLQQERWPRQVALACAAGGGVVRDGAADCGSNGGHDE